MKTGKLILFGSFVAEVAHFALLVQFSEVVKYVIRKRFHRFFAQFSVL